MWFVICRRIFGLCSWKILAATKSRVLSIILVLHWESKYTVLQKCCIFVCCTAYFDFKYQIKLLIIYFVLKLCHFCLGSLLLWRKSSGNGLNQRKCLGGQIETLFSKIHSILISAEFSRMCVGEWFWNMCWITGKEWKTQNLVIDWCTLHIVIFKRDFIHILLLKVVQRSFDYHSIITCMLNRLRFH